MMSPFIDGQKATALDPQSSDEIRTNRSTKSCGECRRRKQKCDQEQPCNNCRRRFPEPRCDYGSRRSAAPTFAITPKAEALLTPSRPSGSLGKSRKQASWVLINRDGIDFNVSRRERHTLTLNLPSSGQVRGSARGNQNQETSASQKGLRALQLDGVVYQCQLTGPVQSILHLPIPPTKQNAMLICKFSEILHPCKGSFEGGTDPDNPFIVHYLPWCVQSPLLALSSLHVAARAMISSGFIDQHSAMLAKGVAISKLNESLRSGDDWAGEEVLAAVVQFMAVEFLFGETEIARAHIKGFRDIIRLRGGFPSHGVGALVTKFALVNDGAIAFWLEDAPIMDKSSEFEFAFDPPAADRFKVRYNCPLGPSSVTFRSCEGVLGMHPATASILDDIRFLINLALEAPLNPSPGQARKLAATATWILDRIRNLNPKFPGGPANDKESCNADLGYQSTGDSASIEVKPHSLLPEYPSYNSMPQNATPSELADGDQEISFCPSEGSQRHNLEVSSAADSTTLVYGDGTRGDSATTPPEADPLYVSVRLAALLYAKAIATRKPLSSVCSPSDALALLSTTWQIPLSRWRGVIGVFIFLLSSIMPAVRLIESQKEDGKEKEPCSSSKINKSRSRTPSMDAGETKAAYGDGPHGGTTKLRNHAEEMAAEAYLRPHCGFVKSIVQIGLIQMGIEDWSLCVDTMKRALALQKWLGRRRR